MEEDELSKLLVRVAVVMEQVSSDAKESKKKKKRAGGDFMDQYSKFNAIQRTINIIDDDLVVYNKDNSAKNRQKAAMKRNERRGLVSKMKGLYDGMNASLKREMDRRKPNLSAEEMDERRRMVAVCLRRYNKVSSEGSAPSRGPTGAGVDMGSVDIEMSNVSGSGKGRSGGGGGGGGGGYGEGKDSDRDAKMNEYQEQQMAQIDREEDEQDEILDQIGMGLDRIQALAEAIGDEGEKQGEILDSLTRAVARAEEHVVSVNDTLKDVTNEVTGGPEKFMISFICCVICVGLVLVIFNSIFSGLLKGS